MSQLLAESLLLAAAGAVLGLVFATWTSRLLVNQFSLPDVRVQLALGLNAHVLAFTATLAIGTALLFGVAPAFRATRVQPIAALQQRGRGLTPRRRFGWGGALVMTQLAVSLVLLTSAGLLVRTFTSLATLDPGFDRDPVLIVGVNAERARPQRAARLALLREITQRVGAIPGVERAALSVLTPVISGDAMTSGMSVPGRAERPGDDEVRMNQVSPAWFATLGTPLLFGRDFAVHDDVRSPRVVIINQAAVRQFFGDQNPIGRTIEASPAPREPRVAMQVVGVVKDAIAGSLRERLRPARYTPLAQLEEVPASLDLSIRVRGVPPRALVRDVAAAVRAVDVNVVLTFRPLREAIDGSLARERLVALLAGFFGLLALLLAAIGIYGLLSYAVTARRTEIGIRLALGSTTRGIAAVVLGDAGRLLLCGVVIGAVVALWVTRFLATLLYALPPRDPATFALAGATLAVVGMLAAWLPARRAARGDPVRVLHQL